MREWFRLARGKTVVRRACLYAIGVGALLIAINHGDAVVRGDVSGERLLRMLLTVMVPYSVSTASSVSALRDQLQEQRRDRSAGSEPRTDPPGRR
jgi:hypothetical protein